MSYFDEKMDPLYEEGRRYGEEYVKNLAKKREERQARRREVALSLLPKLILHPSMVTPQLAAKAAFIAAEAFIAEEEEVNYRDSL